MPSAGESSSGNDQDMVPTAEMLYSNDKHVLEEAIGSAENISNELDDLNKDTKKEKLKVLSSHLYPQKVENSNSSEIIYIDDSKLFCSALPEKPMKDGFPKSVQNETAKGSPEPLKLIHKKLWKNECLKPAQNRVKNCSATRKRRRQDHNHHSPIHPRKRMSFEAPTTSHQGEEKINAGCSQDVVSRTPEKSNSSEESLEKETHMKSAESVTKEIGDLQGNEGIENSHQYSLGDLLWAKIGRYPFWPCMVSYDPNEGCYFKKATTESAEIIYHVQYFGENPQRSWTRPGLILPYDGYLNYVHKRQSLINAAKKRREKRNFGKKTKLNKKIPTIYDVPDSFHLKWYEAIKEAEGAYDIKDVIERYETCVFKYDFNLKKSVHKTRRCSVPSKKAQKKKTSKKPPSALEVYGTEENFCLLCHKGKIDLICTVCSENYHKECVGLIKTPENFVCFYCEKGMTICFICKKGGSSNLKCKKCRYFYHEECLVKFPCANIKKEVCSYHKCVTCSNENSSNASTKEPFTKCILCPSAFHDTKICMPLGSVKLSQTTMICPDHFLGKNKVSRLKPTNFDYCVICTQGGDLICCECCPNAYHIACINAPEIPSDDFFCQDCQNRRYLYVGMIMWGRTGKYRWWPARAVSYEDLPENVKNKEHFDGEFPIQYFGSDEYFWIYRGRVIPYEERHKELNFSYPKKSKLDKEFQLSLTEAREAYNNYILQRNIYNINEKRDAYKYIKVNKIIPPATAIVGQRVSPCNCSPSDSSPCGPSSDCINRSMLMECNPSICPAGVKCRNQAFQKREYAKAKLFKTDKCGWGLKSCEYITKGSFINEYVGEVITHDEYRKRIADMREKHIPNFYFLYLDSRRMIDAGPQGNYSRFINHSCDPNCVMTKWSVNGDSRIGIFAIKDIKPGEEITFNYQCDYTECKQVCYCKAVTCQGFIGKNKKISK